MGYGQQLEQYRKNEVLGATPLQLVVLLYDGAIRFLDHGKAEMLRGNLYEQNIYLTKAQNIIDELNLNLNTEQGGEIASSLSQLYIFITEQLLIANIESKSEPIDVCKKILLQLRNSWAKIAEQTAESAPPLSA